MTPLLPSLLASPESEILEFKEARTNFSAQELCKYVSALANEGGGALVLGVSRSVPRQVVGSQAFPDMEERRRWVQDKMRFLTRWEELHDEQGRRVVVVHVPAHPVGEPVQIDGVAWMREGEELKHLTEVRRRIIYAEVVHDFSADVCPQATLADLAPTAIDAFRERWAERLRRQGQAREAERLMAKNHADFLAEDAELLRAEGVTCAALILFGTRPAVRRFISQAEVIFEYRSNEASGPAADRQEFQEGFFLFHDRLWDRINLRNNKQHFQDGLFMVDVPSFSERPVREAILNAVCHRNYQLPGNIVVRQYPQRLEVASPGGLPPQITPENILTAQSRRNRLLADSLQRSGLVERSGQGMNLIWEGAVRDGKDLPSLRGTDDFNVQITLPGQVKDLAFLQFLTKVGQERLASFTTEDFLLLHAIRREDALSPALRGRMAQLKEWGLIESVGRGKGARWMLARKFATALGRAGHYTRQKGLDQGQNLELLLNHLIAAKKTGAPLKELQQVLPALGASQLRYCLNLLRDTGKAASNGKRGLGGRWYAMAFAPTAPSISETNH